MSLRHGLRACALTHKHIHTRMLARNIFPIWALGLYRRLVLGGAKRLSPEARRTARGAAGWVCAVSDYYTA